MLRNVAHRTAPAAALAALLVGAVACGSSSGSSGSTGSDGGGSTSSTTKASSLPANKATGSPIVVGFINADTNPLGDFNDTTSSMKAAVRYLNDNAGGIAGHKITLETCSDNGSDQAAAGCATKILAKKPVLVVGGFDPGSSASVPLIVKAKVPYLGGNAINSVEFATPGAYSLTSGVAGAITAVDLYLAKKANAKKVGIVTVDIPTGQAAAKQLGQTPLAALGVKASITSHSLTETDLTASWASASKNVDAVVGLETSPGCIALMKARAASGSTIPLYLLGCTDKGTLAGAGTAANGVFFGSPLASPTATDAATKLWGSIMDAYAPGAQRSAYTQGPISSMIILQAAMKSVTGAITPASVLAAVAAIKNLPGFMTPNPTCDGKQVPQLVSLCTGGGYVLQVKNGVVSDVGGGALNLFALLGAGH